MLSLFFRKIALRNIKYSTMTFKNISSYNMCFLNKLTPHNNNFYNFQIVPKEIIESDKSDERMKEIVPIMSFMNKRSNRVKRKRLQRRFGKKISMRSKNN